MRRFAVTLPLLLVLLCFPTLNAEELDESMLEALSSDSLLISLQETPETEVFEEEVFFDVDFEPTTWFRGDYLLWWTKGNNLPPLVTTSPAGTPRSQAGVLGQPNTEILFGNERIDEGERSGFRATLGHWLDASNEVGIEATWFSVFDDSNSGDFFVESPGLPILARPFFDTDSMQQVSEITAFTDPGNTIIAEGSVRVNSSSEMHSASVLLRRLYRQGPRGRLDLIGGFRHFRYREGLLIQEQVIARDPGGLIPLGTTFDLTDQFTTKNMFYGGDLGASLQFQGSRADLEFLAKVALGNLQRRMIVSGQTVVTPPPNAGAPTTTPGGLLTQPTNIGSRRSNDFAALPEFGVNLNVHLNDSASVTFGYTLLLLNDVARSGQQIDTAINATQIGGGNLNGDPSPRPQFSDTDFWAQGMNFSLILRR